MLENHVALPIPDGDLPDDLMRTIEDIHRGINRGPWYDDPMECPKCKEITLCHLQTQYSKLNRKWFKYYECVECNHEEMHWQNSNPMREL